jgi:hypothetical protein
MIETALIIRNDQALTASASSEALALIDDALGSAALVGRVSNAEEQAEAVNAQKKIHGLIATIKKAAKAARDPVNEYAARIIAIERKLTEDLVTERDRVDKLVADFQALELARVRAAENLRILEEQRLQRERDAEAKRIADEATAAQLRLDEQQRDAARKAATASPEEAAAAQEIVRDIERQKEIIQSTSLAQTDAINQQFCQASAALPVVAPTRVAGQNVREDWKIEVTNLHALYGAHPRCVKLTPVMLEIRQLLDAGIMPPGVKAEKEIKAGVRNGRQREAIEV